MKRIFFNWTHSVSLPEAGRIDLTDEKIDHILKSHGYNKKVFDKIVRADGPARLRYRFIFE